MRDSILSMYRKSSGEENLYRLCWLPLITIKYRVLGFEMGRVETDWVGRTGFLGLLGCTVYTA